MRHDLLSHLNEKICRVSDFRANQLIENGEAERTVDGVRLLPPLDYNEDQRNKLNGGTMRDAWQIRESAGYLVMQLRTERCETQA